METSPNYSSENIQVYTLIEAIRKRPGMYIGAVDRAGIFYLFREIIEFCLKNKDWKTLKITTYKENTYRFEFDNFWFDTKDGKENSFDLINKLRENDYYNFGFIILTALSEKIIFKLKNKKIVFHKGQFQEITISHNKTFSIDFSLDKGLFPIPLPISMLYQLLQNLSFLNPHRILKLVDNNASQTFTITSKDGLLDYFHLLSFNRNILTNPIRIIIEDLKYEIEIVFSFIESSKKHKDKFQMLYYVNGQNCKDGGTHQKAFEKAIKTSYKDLNLENYTHILGVVGIIHLHVPENEIFFAGATKAKLDMPHIERWITKSIKNAITEEFSQHSYRIAKLQTGFRLYR